MKTENSVFKREVKRYCTKKISIYDFILLPSRINIM